MLYTIEITSVMKFEVDAANEAKAKRQGVATIEKMLKAGALDEFALPGIATIRIVPESMDAIDVYEAD